jgi:hypothetical protein
MRAMRSISSARAFASIDTASFRFGIIRSRSFSCTTAPSFASVNSRLQKVIPTVVFSVVWSGQQQGERQKSFLTQTRSLRNLYLGAFWQQHPHRNLQPLPRAVDNADRAVSPCGSTDDAKALAMKRVERVEDSDLRGVYARGIVGAGGIIPTSTASCRPGDSHPMARAGSTRVRPSSCP